MTGGARGEGIFGKKKRGRGRAAGPPGRPTAGEGRLGRRGAHAGRGGGAAGPHGLRGRGRLGQKGRRGERKRKGFSFSNFLIFLYA
jgi:hypothetical protein